MKIVFLNVWGDEMQHSLIPYLEEQAVDTDVFCFQEATLEMKDQCASVLANYEEVLGYKWISEKDNFPQSTFIKKGIDVLSSGALMSKEMDRGLAIYVELKYAGQRVFVCNVHGKARPSDKLDDEGRIAQSQALIDFFKESDVPVVIGGDFNILPDTRSIRMFEEAGLTDLIKTFSVDTTRNHLAWDRYPIKMYYSDYVFLNPYVRFKSFEVPKNEVSDHLPMIVNIEPVATE